MELFACQASVLRRLRRSPSATLPADSRHLLGQLAQRSEIPAQGLDPLVEAGEALVDLADERLEVVDRQPHRAHVLVERLDARADLTDLGDRADLGAQTVQRFVQLVELRL